MSKNKNLQLDGHGCCDCKHNFFGECDKYGYWTETELVGISVCDYDGWELDE